MRQSATAIDDYAPTAGTRRTSTLATYDIATTIARLDSLRTAFDSWREVTVGADFPPRDAVRGAC